MSLSMLILNEIGGFNFGKNGEKNALQNYQLYSICFFTCLIYTHTFSIIRLCCLKENMPYI